MIGNEWLDLREGRISEGGKCIHACCHLREIAEGKPLLYLIDTASIQALSY